MPSQKQINFHFLQKNKGTVFGFLSLFCSFFAFALRALPYQNFLTKNGHYLLYSNDSYDHLRRASLILHNYPNLPSWDFYWGYPLGSSSTIWTPVFDWIVASLAFFLTVFSSSPPEVALHFIAFWFPPLLAFFTILLISHIGSLFFTKGTGLATALFLTLLPAHIYFTFVSELDHHAIEPLLCLAIIWAHYFGLSSFQLAEKRVRGLLIPTFFMFIALLVWRGSIIFWGCSVLALFLQSFRESDTAQHPAVTVYASAHFLLLATVLSFLCFFELFGTSSTFLFNIVSWFHVLFCGITSALFYSLYHLKKKSLAWYKTCGIAITLILIGFVVFRDFIEEFFQGLAVVGAREDPWLDSISELRSILYPARELDISHAGQMLSFLFWALPLVAFFWFRQWQKTRSFKFILCFSFGLFFWVLPFFRERYIHITAVLVALAFGYLVNYCYRFFKKKQLSNMAPVLLICLLTVILFPAFPFLKNLPNIALPNKERLDLPLTMQWIRENTPETSHYLNPIKPPDYGILTDWSLGAYVSSVGQRPSMATGFGWETYGLFPSSDFLTTADPQRARTLLIENKIRYIVLRQEVDLQSLFEIVRYKSLKDNDPMPPPLKPFESQFYRLYYQNGARYAIPGGGTGKQLADYRLVYQSPGGFMDPFAGFVANYKIFEFTGILARPMKKADSKAPHAGH